jgi:hypothetical protein
MTTTDIPAIDEARLEAFVGQAVVDMGAAISGLLLHIGDRLGLYKAMAGAGPITSSTLAQRTGTTERYVREWLGNQAAGGYVAYNPADSTYELPAEQAMVVANEDSPVFLGGAFEAIASCYADHDVFVDAFRTGAGVGWQDHDDRLFSGVVRFFRPGYAAHLVGEWLPALDGVVEKLRAGGERCRRGVRTRRVHGDHGAGVRALDVRGLRHPRAVDRGRPQGRGAGRREPAGEVRRRAGEGLPGPGL